MTDFPTDMPIDCIPYPAFVPGSKLLQELILLVELKQWHILYLQHFRQICVLVSPASTVILTSET